jgi:anti-sigma B factor antagonist
MHIETAECNGATVIKPIGDRIDLSVAGELRAELLRLIEAGRHHLVVDMEHVLFMDSSGLGALVSALRALKMLNGDGEAGGDIRLANVQPSVVSLLEIIRLHRVFASYPSVDGAVRSFS